MCVLCVCDRKGMHVYTYSQHIDFFLRDPYLSDNDIDNKCHLEFQINHSSIYSSFSFCITEQAPCNNIHFTVKIQEIKLLFVVGAGEIAEWAKHLPWMCWPSLIPASHMFPWALTIVTPEHHEGGPQILQILFVLIQRSLSRYVLEYWCQYVQGKDDNVNTACFCSNSIHL